MADTSNTDDSQTPLLEKHGKTLDETIERFIGSFGWAQLLQAVAVSFAWVFDAQQTFISVFADAAPAWHCIDPHMELCNSTTISNLCKLPRDAWTWNEPIQTSTVSEWGLSCLGPVIAGLPTSSFFFGCLLGGLVLATLADSSLGRKNLLVISCLIMSSSTLLTAFSPNIWIYSILRFVTGFGRATIGTCSLVLSTEIVGKSRRDKVGIIGFICFTLGFLSLPAMAYFTRGSSWRMLYILTSVPAMVYSIIVHFMTYESPRWLMVQGRKEEAIHTLRSIASPDIYGSNNNLLSISLSGIDLSIEPKQSNTDLYASIKMLWDKTWAFRRLSAVMVVSFGVGMMYYGVPLGVGNLASSLYLSVTLNALSELPSSLITYFLIGRLRRRSSMLFFTMLSGFCSIMCVVIHQGQQALRIGVELVSFFSACTAFNVLLIYTLELFPTCVRNSALSMARQALVFGGIFSPILIAAERGVDDNGFLSYGVFGLVIIVCGLFIFCLPETRGEIICDTMEEEEDKKAKNKAPDNKTLITLV
ncbi:hypothetical protein MKX03_009365 [Papaver bracteatum]|nr:hypothetical protein MKX03_009365 [Papaver bracteatum]